MKRPGIRTPCRILAVGVLLIAISSATAADPVRIGVVFDGEATVTAELFDQVKKEILTLTEGEFDVRFEDQDVHAGDWTVRSVNASIDTLLKDPEVDLVLALGPLASHTFCCREVLPKPVIAGVVIDSRLQDLPRQDGASGVHNLNYLAFPASFERDLDVFLEIVPFSKLTVVFNRWFLDVVPEISEQIRELVAQRDLGFELVAVGDSVEQALAAIPDDAEAVYLAPLLHLSDADRQRFIEGLKQRYLPSFSLFGVAEVTRGVYAAQRDSAFYDRLARRIALNVQRILLGEEPGTIPVTVPDRRRLVINMETARAIGIYPPWHLLTEAELLNEKVESFPVLTLSQAVERAVDANLDLAARTRDVAAGAQAVRQARAVLRPRLDVDLTGVQIDRDRAAMDFSAQAEVTWTAGLTLTQLIYSDPALANVKIQGHAQLSREQELEQLRLDIVQATMISYVNVLLAETVEQIRKSNLEVSRSNLELAQVRRSVGTAGPGEVYRWQSEVATARRDLVDARAATYQARVALNRLMARRLEEGFKTVDVTFEAVMGAGTAPDGAVGSADADQEPILFRGRQQVLGYIQTPLHFEIFRQFMVEEGLSRAPELAQLDAAIDAQERALTSARRAYWAPEVALQASFDERLETGGETSVIVDSMADESWSLGLSATLPLWSGGSRGADVIEAEETLAGLELQRRVLAKRLEQLIRSELFVTNASYSGIRLTHEAATAARKNLDVVTDAYSRGVVDVLDLLDAQNASLQAELASATALYEFLINLVDVERAINWFEVERTAPEQAAWFGRLQAFFAEHGLKPRPVPALLPEEQP